jgi:transposase
MNGPQKLGTNPTFGVFFMAQYDEEFKQAILEEYLKGASGFKVLSAKFGVNRIAIKGWVNLYRHHGDAGLRKRLSHYSARFKLSVLNQMWQQGLFFNQVAALFDLRGGARMVSGWARRYYEGGLDALERKSRGRPKKMKNPEIPPSAPVQPQDACAREDLRKENEYLRAEVAYLKKLDTLVRAKIQKGSDKYCHSEGPDSRSLRASQGVLRLSAYYSRAAQCGLKGQS